jgi:hypothetical protein
LTTYQLIDLLRRSITFATIPSKKRPRAFTADSPSPPAAAVKKPRTYPAKTLQKGKALKKVESVQETHVSVDAFRAQQYIGREDAIPIFCDSIEINKYKEHIFYFFAHTFLVVRNLKLKEHDVIFKKTVPDSAADCERQGQLLDQFEDMYLSLPK